jgi:type IX secretion system PorP/SprF family membrane protein
MNLKSIISILALLGVGTIFAQQLPLGSQYYTNMFTINPAFAGKSESVKAFLSHRSQFNGLQGGPQTSLISVNGATNDKKIGLGIIAYNDATDILAKTSAMINYSYGLKLTETQNLHFGLAMGVQNFRIDFTKAKVVNESDPILYGDRQSKSVFNADFGLLYEWNKLQIGIAVPQLLTNKPTFSNISGEDLRYRTNAHFRTTAQYAFDVTSVPNLQIIPLGMLRVVNGAPIQYDLNLIADHKNRGWFGLTYHSGNSFAVSAGLRYNNLTFGYAHDFALGVVNNYAKTSSEFILSYQFSNKKTDQTDWSNRISELERKTQEQQIQIDSLSRIQKGQYDNLTKEQEATRDSLNQKSQELQRQIGELKKRPVQEVVPADKETKTRLDTTKIDADTTNPEPKVEDIPTIDDTVVLDPPVSGRYLVASSDEYERANGQEVNKGFYIVTGSFGVRSNADRWADKSRTMGYEETGILINKEIKMNEVFVFFSNDRALAIEQLEGYTNLTPRTWILELK